MLTAFKHPMILEGVNAQIEVHDLVDVYDSLAYMRKSVNEFDECYLFLPFF